MPAHAQRSLAVLGPSALPVLFRPFVSYAIVVAVAITLGATTVHAGWTPSATIA